MTTTLSDQLRSFQKHTCTSFKTRELKREAKARQSKNAKRDTTKETKKSEPQSKRNKQSTKDNSKSEGVPSCMAKSFNLATYKVHSLGDYVETIRMYGTTDSYSTEPVCDLMASFYKLLITCFGRASLSIVIPRQITSEHPRKTSRSNLHAWSVARHASSTSTRG